MADDPLTTSSPEHKRLEAEIHRIEAETAKLLAERIEIEKRVRTPWYLGRYVIGGIVAAGLLAAWIRIQVEPMITAKHELAAIGIEVAKKQNELQSLINQIASEKLNKDLAELRNKNTELLLQQTRLQ